MDTITTRLDVAISIATTPQLKTDLSILTKIYHAIKTDREPISALRLAIQAISHSLGAESSRVENLKAILFLSF